MADPLLERIRAFLNQTGLAPSRFGRLAANDPRFVRDLERGRSPTGRKAAQIMAFMERHEAERRTGAGR